MKALIAMSGGVDSSVAALLIKNQGYDATGVTMKLYDNDDIGVKKENTCCSVDDIADARAVCNRLSIPYYVFNFKDSFNEEVIERFINAYENGSTPNPCIDCNRYIKFERLMRRMKELEMDYVVTGHYARIEYDETSGRYLLKKAVDDSKDQSYVLYSLNQEQLKHTLFPLGTLNKSEVRNIAEKNGFINAKKHDSQDICFVPDGKYAEFMENYTGKKYERGDFVDKDGNVLGEHNGIIRYTIGQRKGLGLALPEPMYVCAKDLVKNKVILSKNEDLFSKELYAEDINLISLKEIKEPMRIYAKVRYNQKAQPATAEQIGDRLRVVFDEPQRAICKGQAVVLYDGDVVVGGGTIV
ncbi:MAG: tRNA 2-thiouridine(34) synthase MnmA [Ruminococcus sp.]|nr:tRNA 2-thiouridine(34) synthase MnmA [Ruminococcus sp.]